MARPIVGCVPYLNAKPLVAGLASPDAALEVRYDVPSRLPGLLDAGAAAIMVSSIEALRMPGARVCDGVAIASDGPVWSVKLFSQRPFGEIRRVAFDASSMTSNVLAQIVLRDGHGVRVTGETRPPDLRAMLAEFDACVLIGDIGMSAPEDGLLVMDLGAAWQDLTGLPFVWAMWTGRERLTPAVAAALQASAEYGRRHRPEVAAIEAPRIGWTAAACERYLTEAIRFDLCDREWRGLAEFGRRAAALSLLEGWRLPERIGAVPQTR